MDAKRGRIIVNVRELDKLRRWWEKHGGGSENDNF